MNTKNSRDKVSEKWKSLKKNRNCKETAADIKDKNGVLFSGETEKEGTQYGHDNCIYTHVRKHKKKSFTTH